MLSRCCITALVILFSVGICVGFASTPDEAKAIEVSNTITGLNRLPDVRITAAAFTMPKNDDTPIRFFRNKLIEASLWKVSYKIEALQHENMTNPHIKGFDVYVDVADEKVLKIVSRDAKTLGRQFRKGIKVSNRQLRQKFRKRAAIERALPSTIPPFDLADHFMGTGMETRHYECYYFVHRVPNSHIIFPAWLIIYYGAEPIEALGAFANSDSPPKPRKRRKLADGYVRTLEYWIYDAKDGEPLGGGQLVGKNTDTFQ